jgi:hypothetical protein
MSLLAIDPGNTHSAYVILDAGRPVEFQRISNEELLGRMLEQLTSSTRWGYINRVAIEMIASYGMPVGREVFETCLWIGRFIQACSGVPYELVYRKDVKMHLCGQTRAKDGNIRQALIDRFGPGKAATGTKKAPGPLYGVSGDVWAALAVAVTKADEIARLS